jgi:tripartite-type tricarboxylate transporter receptor subunit TctC
MSLMIGPLKAAALALLTAALVSHAVAAERYPSRPIKLVVAFAPGGVADVMGRIVAQALQSKLNQTVFVENKPGGDGLIGMGEVVRAAPDGYTLLVGASGAMSINPAVYTRLSYDSIRDFIPVSELGSFPLILIVNASSPIKSVAELVAYAKANPDKANYSSASAAFQLATELFKQKTGAPLQEIPYKGAADSVMAVISGQVTATIADAGPVSGQIKGGQVRALAVAASSRTQDLPDIPTMKEAGADVEAVLWSGIFVPKNTPPSIVKKLESEFMRIARLPDVIDRFKPLGIESVGNSSDQFAKILAADIARWTEVARAANIKLEQ